MDLKAGAVLYAKDIDRVSNFYARAANLAILHSEADHVVLESAWFQLVVVAIPQQLAAAIEITAPPSRRENTPVKLVFCVPSLSAVRVAAAQCGGQLHAAEREWDFLNHRVCDGLDPEGNVVQFRMACA